MASPTNSGTRDIPLKFAKGLTELVNAEWENGHFLAAVSPITADLLRYWFEPSFCDVRDRNFHDGQRQAILNAIYVHEVLKSNSVVDMYAHLSNVTDTSYIDQNFTDVITADKYRYPKYCVKMATGTGKTWVLNALLIWQYLNAKYQTSNGVKYTKNFLLIAPGLIVYERLLDAFRGKEIALGRRDFETSDLKSNQELFVPEKYRQDVFSFIQNAVADKKEIGNKTTGGGIIAITNWHKLNEDTPDGESETQIMGFDFGDTQNMASEILPVTPGVASGNALDALDAKYLRGGVIEYLAGLPDLCVFNDEAHHIHESKSNGIVAEVEWQRALNTIADPKGNSFIQIDFSATPYIVTGGGKNRTKHFFPHIVTNFELATAMKAGFVKTFILDKRKELGALSNAEIEFKAVREGKQVIGLSEGQRLMLRAGLSRLNILREDFENFKTKKSPKMLVICEDTDVSPFVVDFLRSEGLAEDDIMRIDSNRKGEIPPDEWEQTKQQLFNMDKSDKPKVVVSVMMLREGFDVNSICVIVPLRSSEAPILLEQVLGRGLRLMWREPEFQDSKAENRHNIYDLKQEPVNYLDTLFVIEHPAFEKFYDDLDKSLLVEEPSPRPKGGGRVLGDMISVGLKPNFAELNLFWPRIVKDKEETMSGDVISVESMNQWDGARLDDLKKLVPNDNDERFVGVEMQVKTRFGEYRVRGDIFNAKSYNEYLQKMLNTIIVNMAKMSSKGHKAELPLMQIDQALLMRTIDKYIRTRLFGQEFDPLVDGNWRVLILSNGQILQHTLTELSKAVYEMHTRIDVAEAVVEKHWFSQVDTMFGRENFALDIKKSIYEKTFYPSTTKLEKDFLEYCDADSAVERLIKIDEHKHPFAHLRYLRQDGMLGTYHPDFMVKIGNKMYVVETKGDDRAKTADVCSKETSAVDWVAKINELPESERMGCEWSYVLLTGSNFYALRDQNANIQDILSHSKLTRTRAQGTLI